MLRPKFFRIAIVQSSLNHAKMQAFWKPLLRIVTNLEKSPIAANIFDSGTTKDYYTHIFKNKRSKFQLFNISEDVTCY